MPSNRKNARNANRRAKSRYDSKMRKQLKDWNSKERSLNLEIIGANSRAEFVGKRFDEFRASQQQKTDELYKLNKKLCNDEAVGLVYKAELRYTIQKLEEQLRAQNAGGLSEDEKATKNALEIVCNALRKSDDELNQLKKYQEEYEQDMQMMTDKCAEYEEELKILTYKCAQQSKELKNYHMTR